MNNPITETANWQTQYLVTYLASGNANPVIVPSDEWVVSGNAATGVFPAGQTIGGVMDTYLSDNAPSSVTAPTTITGFYQVSYLVTYLASGNANPVIVPYLMNGSYLAMQLQACFQRDKLSVVSWILI